MRDALQRWLRGLPIGFGVFGNCFAHLLIRVGGRDNLTLRPAVASDALLRVSELVGLEVGDVDFTTGTVTVRKSKTDQEAEGAVLYLGKPTLKRVQRWLEASGIEAGPL